MRSVMEWVRKAGAGGLLVGLLAAWIAVAGYLALLPDPPEGIFGADGSHAVISFILVFGAGCLVLTKPGRFLRLIGAGVAMGVIVELAQLVDAQGRSLELVDILADFAGVLAGAAAAALSCASGVPSSNRPDWPWLG